MHIPDGYLSPATCGVFYLVMIPVWYFTAWFLKNRTTRKTIPLIGLGATFTFIVMMLNLPIPGGTSGHMTGGIIVAIVLGPWGGMLSMTLAILIQAVLFADGGITSLAANSFNMAFVIPFAGYYIYRFLSGDHPSAARKQFSAIIAAYTALNISAVAVGFELGIQPAIAHSATGIPLYAPYPLEVALPAMMIPHLTILGFVEAVGTAMVAPYLEQVGKEHMAYEGRGPLRPLVRILIVLLFLTPLGLIAGGTAWGEWTPERLSGMLGYMPQGYRKIAGIWHGIIPNYNLPGMTGTVGSITGYLTSAAVGTILILGIIHLLEKKWHRN